MIKKLFPTLIYESKLPAGIKNRLNKQLLREIEDYSANDDAGIAWSKKNYKGGYTSYSSITNFHKLSPTFEELERELNGHVKKFIKELDYNLKGRKLQMTTCWVNVMPQNTYHPLHIHPLCTISGTYYVNVPAQASSLKIEDTKMSSLMSAPPRKKDDYYYHFKPKAGDLILFESWVRHEVPPNQAKQKRVSISFNYEWI